MKVLHLNAGNETGGGMYYLLRTLRSLSREYPNQFILGVMEKKELYQRAEAARIPIVYFKLPSIFNLLALFRLLQFIKKERISHVHTHGPRANVVMNILRHFLSVRWIVTVHSDPTVDFSHIGWRKYLYTKLHLVAISNADYIISVCRAFYPVLFQHGVKEDRVTTIVNGIDFSTGPSLATGQVSLMRERKGFTKNDFLFVQVARLEEVKGHRYALEAMKQLIGRGFTNVHLLLVGAGSLKEDLQALSEQLQIEPHVHFLGERSERDVLNMYEIADVTILPSLSESFPYVLLESARAKKPVIATNVGDIKRLINNLSNSWLIKSKSIESLAEAMEKAVLAKEKGELEAIGERFYHYVSERFTLSACVRAIYRVYSEKDPEIE